jgi:plastocyanin
MVTWKNEDRRDHQIMSGAPPVMTDMFASPVLRKGESWSYTFEEPGEYPYHSMTGSFTGVVNVEQ